MGPDSFAAMDYHDAGRLLLAVVLGGLIGFERRLHGHAAGPHTNGLVAFGAALFVLIGQQLGPDSSGRVISQVATGVGFLAGGVILRDGLRVRGLNTAATVWCVAAMGCFVAVGFVWLAVTATLIIVAANTLFHIIEHRVPQLADVEEEDQDERDRRNRGRDPAGKGMA